MIILNLWFFYLFQLIRLSTFLSILAILPKFIINVNKKNYCNWRNCQIWSHHFGLNPYDVINQSISRSLQYPFSYASKFLISCLQFISLFLLILYPYLLLFLASPLTFINRQQRLFQPPVLINFLCNLPTIVTKIQQILQKLFFIFKYIPLFRFLLLLPLPLILIFSNIINYFLIPPLLVVSSFLLILTSFKLYR